MSWPKEKDRNPHVAYVIYDTEHSRYIRFIAGEPKYIEMPPDLCYATMFPTAQRAYQKMDNTNFSDFGVSFINLLVKKVILG